MDKKNTNRKNWLALLKNIMVFVVVLIHVWENHQRSADNVSLWIFDYYFDKAVLVLLILSFYFMGQKFFDGSFVLLSRIKRLAIPYFFWGLFYWCILILPYVVKGELSIGNSLVLLLKQFINGGELYPPYWYMLIIIIFTLFYSILFRYIDNRRVIFYSIIGAVICLLAQYLGINVKIWQHFSPADQYTLGRFAEMFPATTLGLALAYFRVLDKVKEYRLLIAIPAFTLFLIDFIFGIFSQVEGWTYAGLGPLVMAVITILFVSTFPDLERFQNSRIIAYMGSYTLGIYSMHVAVVYFLYLATGLDSEKVNFAFYVLVFLISYLVSFLVAHIPLKGFKALVE